MPIANLKAAPVDISRQTFMANYCRNLKKSPYTSKNHQECESDHYELHVTSDVLCEILNMFTAYFLLEATLMYTGCAREFVLKNHKSTKAFRKAILFFLSSSLTHALPMKTQGRCAYKSTPCHMIPTETLYFTPIRPAARDWNEFHRCGSASWQVTPPTWRRRDKDRWRKGWWRGHEGVKRGNGQRSDIKGICAKIHFAASLTYLTDVVLILFRQVGLICMSLHNFQFGYS